MCEYCEYGLPLKVADIYDQAIKRLGGDDYVLEFSVGHIVWGDYNFHHENIKYCLDNFEELKKYDEGRAITPDDYKVLRWSLEELEKIDGADFRIMEDVFYDKCPFEVNYKDYKKVKPTRFPK